MENKFVTIITLGFASLFTILAYIFGLNETTANNAGNAIEGIENANVQGIIGIILLLMLVVSIFFIVGNVKIMLQKNFHKK